LRKIINWIMVEGSMMVKPASPWGWPTHFQIEPASRCNLSCALCPVTEGMDRPTGSMELDLYKRLIDEAGDFIFIILLWDWGEPFLNPSIYEMISCAKGKGIKLVSSTNGHIFTSKEHADRLVMSGLDSLIVALDGISQETYEPYRHGGSLEAVFRGIRTVVERKNALGSSTPLINMRFIPMKHNEHEIPRLKDLARELGVDALTIKTLNPHSNDSYLEKRMENKGDEKEFIPKNPFYRRFRYIDGDLSNRMRRKSNPCRQLWNNPVVHWDGMVCPCTYDYREKYILGDLKKNSFKEIWFGETYGSMRRQFRREWEGLAICGECSYAYKGGSCISEIIAEAFFFENHQGGPAELDALTASAHPD
jgi:radical SAM protein with 4Fe4S-binding SPASM domain